MGDFSASLVSPGRADQPAFQLRPVYHYDAGMARDRDLLTVTLEMMRILRMKLSILAAMAAAVIALPTLGQAQNANQVGKVNFAGGSAAAGIGFSWGSGTLEFAGKTYQFKVTGFSVGDVGAASIDAVGEVYNLTKVEDFEGNYAAAGLGGTLAGGGTIIAMENPHGVIIQAHSTTAGLRLNIAASGITFTLVK
jgi:hypothetical protein